MAASKGSRLVAAIDLIYRCMHDETIVSRADRLDHAHDMLIKKLQGDPAEIAEAWDMAAALGFVSRVEAEMFIPQPLVQD